MHHLITSYRTATPTTALTHFDALQSTFFRQSVEVTIIASMSAASDAAAARTISATGTPAAAAAAPSTVDKTGYTGFGSFHSDDVEVLIRQDTAQYIPPALPFPDPADQHSLTQPSAGTAQATGRNESSKQESNSSSSRGSSSWGLGARQQFLIDFNRWTFINHGAFGGTSR